MTRLAPGAVAALLFTACASAPPAVPVPAEDRINEAAPADEGFTDAGDDRAEEIAQLLAQAEATLGNGPALDPARRDEIAAHAETLRAAVDREAELLGSGAPDEDVAAAADAVAAAADGLRAALAAVADAEDAGGADADEADPWDHGEPVPGEEPGAHGGPSFLDRIVGLLDSTLLVLDRIHQLRSSTHALSQDGGVPPQVGGAASWPDDAFVEVSGLVTLDGEPVAGARVAEPTLGREAFTGPDGVYHLALPPRTMRLVVIRDGSPMAEATVLVRRGRGAPADIELRRAGGRAQRAGILPSDVALRGRPRGPAGTIRAVVEDGTGLKLARALVRLDGSAAARTDGAGRCTFRRVATGAHRLTIVTAKGPIDRPVQVEAARTVEATLTVDAATARAVRPRPPATRSVGPSRVPGPRPSPVPRAVPSHRPAPPGPARGGVIQGRVTAGGKAVAGAELTIAGRAGDRHVRTSRDGSFRVEVASAGTYRIRIRKPGFADEEGSVHVRGGDRSTASFVLRPDRAAEKSRRADPRPTPASKKRSKKKPAPK